MDLSSSDRDGIALRGANLHDDLSASSVAVSDDTSTPSPSGVADVNGGTPRQPNAIRQPTRRSSTYAHDLLNDPMASGGDIDTSPRDGAPWLNLSGRIICAVPHLPFTAELDDTNRIWVWRVGRCALALLTLAPLEYCRTPGP